MAKVLVTGASGFVGRHTLAPLVANGDDVHAVTSKRANAVDVDGVTWHEANLLDADGVGGLVDEVKASHLLHCAWYVVPGKLISATENFDWVAQSMHLVRQFHAAGGERVVGVGSCYEYDWRYGYCTEGATPTEPDTVYGATKNALRQMIQAYGAVNNLSMAWGRAFFLYGPAEFPKRLAASIILSLLNDEPAKCSHGRQIRDYAHVQDVADGLVALLHSDYNGALNIATGEAPRVRDVATTIGDVIGKPELIQLGALPARPNDTALVVADVTRSREVLDWEPKFDLESGLRHTVEWWKQNPPGDMS